MLFDILPLKNNTARLIRVYGDEPCIAVPGEVPGPGGEKWTLTELGDYCFSEKLRNLPAADALCRYEVGGDGAVTLTRAFGRALTGRRRYDLDFGDAPEETDLHPVCGNFLEEAVLPDGLQVIGSCAFYNCRRLRRLSFGAADLTVGSADTSIAGMLCEGRFALYLAGEPYRSGLKAQGCGKLKKAVFSIELDADEEDGAEEE